MNRAETKHLEKRRGVDIPYKWRALKVSKGQAVSGMGTETPIPAVYY
jgi:hypothetical protein